MNWLLLRGLAREARHWETFPETLEATLNCRAFSLDLPGVGTEHLRESPYTMRGIVADLRARYLSLRRAHPGPFSLLGISLGGMVSMAWLESFPGDFQRLVLVNSSASNVARPYERLRPQVLLGLLRTFRQAPFERELNILNMTTATLTDVERIATRWASYALDRPIKRSLALRQIAAALAFRAPKRLPLPILALSSAGDGFVNRICTERLAGHLGCAHVEHPSAGHDLTIEAPEWTAREIERWIGTLAQVGLASRAEAAQVEGGA